MVTNSQIKWWSRGITLVVWTLAAASAAWWGLRASVGTAVTVPPAAAISTNEPSADAGAVGRVLGAVTQVSPTMPVVNAASRYALLGVVAGRSEGGAALISIDGKPAKPYRVGASLEGDLTLQAVEPRRARLGGTAAGAASMVLDLPPVKR